MNRIKPVASRPRRRTASVAGLVIGISAVLAACGGSDSSSTVAKDSGGTAECKSVVADLNKKNVAAKSQDWYPEKTPDASVVKGKSYWVIPLTTAIPLVADYANGFKAAGDAVGAKVTVFDGKATPGGITQGVNNAIAAKADAIVLVLIDPTSVASAMKNAVTADIPVVLSLGGEAKTPFSTGVAAMLGQDLVAMGRTQGIAALHATGCDLNALLVGAPGNVASDASSEGIKQAVEEYCGDACSLEEVGVQAADIATKTTSSVQNALRRDPKINIVFEVADAYTPFDEAAIKAVGSKANIVTSTAMTNLKGMGEGTSVKAAAVYAPALAQGWFFVDALIRLGNGEKDVVVDYPTGIVDETNRDASDPSSYSGTSPYANYPDEFKKLWGVTG